MMKTRFTSILTKAAMMLLTVLLTMTAQTAWAATVQFPIYTGDEGTSGKPYQIKTIDDLNKLAQDVNSGTNYLNKYFKLMNDLDFYEATNTALRPTTAWDDESSTENNYTAIGIYGKSFSGHFDGNNKTIRGLRIYTTNHYQGIFGNIANSAVVENITLTDARLAGGYYIGGIVGDNTSGTVTNCHVRDDVAIVAKNSGNCKGYGGIAGSNTGTVSYCTSAVKIAVADGANAASIGGIAGANTSSATLTDNFVLGAVIPAARYNTHAAIAVDEDYTSAPYLVSYARNYYWDCTVAGTPNATDVGIATYMGEKNVPLRDITANDGAVRKPLYTLTLADGITAEATPVITVSGTPYYSAGTTVTLSGKQSTPNPPAGSIYGGYAVNGTAISGNTFNMPAEDVTVTSNIIQCHTLTVADGITATATPTITVGSTPYYSPGTTVTLSYNGTLPTGCIHDYIVNGTAISGNTFNMPAEDVTVTSNTIQCYTLTLADGITATPTPTITVGSTPYYRPGTTVALSYTGDLSPGYGPVYAMTKDGTSDVVTTPGTFSMPASNVTITVTVTDLWGVSANPAADGSADHPYVITNAAGLDLLAQRVNGGEGYDGKYFKLMNDIAYTYTTAWNAADSQENNFTRIGDRSRSFSGSFDGQGHTISGIRIYSSDNNQGLFGYINGGCVRNITLADARITGKNNVAGIVGYNGSTIENCHVTTNVLIGATGDNPSYHGGIAGQNDGTVDGCTSSATLSQAKQCGGIVGFNESDITVVMNCLAIGVTINGNEHVGAIVASNEGGTLNHNYYSGCTVNGMTYGIGCSGADVTDNDGAVEAIILSDAANVHTKLSGKVAFRREFTGGKASTVVFPFDYEKGTEGTYYTFGGVTYDGNKGKWIATMNEYTGTTLSANTPYLFVPAGTEAHKPVLFHGEAAATISAGTTTNGDWTFKGVYAEKTWAAADCGRDYGFAATSGKAVDGVTDVEAGDFVMLAEGAHIKPLRSYLTYTGSDNPWATTNAPAHRASTGDMPASISVVLVSADGSTTSLENVQCSMFNVQCDNSWYTLGGTRLNGKPSAKGLYIHNGLKVVIK